MNRRFGGVRVLVVDKCPIYRHGIIAQLAQQGASCSEVGSAEEALALFQPGQFDLLLTDSRLSGQTGAWLVRHLRTQQADLRSIIFCLRSESGVMAAFGSGADALLFKDTPLCDFVACVERVLRGLPSLTREIQQILVRQVRTRLTGRPAERPDLTQREREVCRLLVRGALPEQISEQLAITPSTVKTYFRNLYRKFEVTSRADLVVRLMSDTKKRHRRLTISVEQRLKSLVDEAPEG